MSIDEDDIFITELSRSQDIETIDTVVDYLKTHGPSSITDLVNYIHNKKGVSQTLIRNIIQDACDQQLIIFSKKASKILGEALIYLK